MLSGLDNTGARSRSGSSGAHAKPAGAFMTGVEPLPTTGSSGLQLGISMDQILANTSASADAEITLSEPLVFGDEDDMSLRVTLSHMADSAEAMRPDLDEEGRGRLLLDALRQRVTVEVER